MDNTGIIITLIVGVVSLIFVILKYSDGRSRVSNENTIKQAELSVKLANIEKELAEIKCLLVSSAEHYQTLEKRVFILEQKK